MHACYLLSHTGTVAASVLPLALHKITEWRQCTHHRNDNMGATSPFVIPYNAIGKTDAAIGKTDAAIMALCVCCAGQNHVGQHRSAQAGAKVLQP